MIGLRLCDQLVVGALFLLSFFPTNVSPYPLPPGNLTHISHIFPSILLIRQLPPTPTVEDPAVVSELSTNTKSSPYAVSGFAPALNHIDTDPGNGVTSYHGPKRFTGWKWVLALLVAILLVLPTGLLAGLTLGVMSVDNTKLRVWTKTGTAERKRQASAIFALRRHPNWLLTTLILSSVAVAEALPLILNHLFAAGALIPFIVATVLVAFIGELIPQAIVPLYILGVASRMTWFMTALMWLTAPLSIPLGWVFRQCKVWGKAKQGWKADGVLDCEELGEFVRLHEVGIGLGGQLGDRLGEVLRGLIERGGGCVGRPGGWEKVYKVNEQAKVDEIILETARMADCPFFFVERGIKGADEVVGAISTKSIRACVVATDSVFVRDLPIHSIPIVKEDCELMALADLFMSEEERVALVVPANENIGSHFGGTAWTSGGRHGKKPQGQIISQPVHVLGIISSHDFLRTLFTSAFKPASLIDSITRSSWSENPDNDVEFRDNDVPQPSNDAELYGGASMYNNIPPELVVRSPDPEPVLVDGLRKRSISQRFLTSDEVNEERTSPRQVTLSGDSRPSGITSMDGAMEIEHFLVRTRPYAGFPNNPRIAETLRCSANRQKENSSREFSLLVLNTKVGEFLPSTSSYYGSSNGTPPNNGSSSSEYAASISVPPLFSRPHEGRLLHNQGRSSSHGHTAIRWTPNPRAASTGSSEKNSPHITLTPPRRSVGKRISETMRSAPEFGGAASISRKIYHEMVLPSRKQETAMARIERRLESMTDLQEDDSVGEIIRRASETEVEERNGLDNETP